MSSKKRASLTFLCWLICLSVLFALSPFGKRSSDTLIGSSDASLTRYFTAEEIVLYLEETYGDKADQIWKEWGNDKEWADMITHAQAGDTLALIASDGSVSWYHFKGYGRDKLNGIYEVLSPDGFMFYGDEPISGEALEKVRANYALIGGLFRESDNTIALSWYPSGLQEGKRGYSGSVSEIDVHTVTQIEYYAWKHGIILFMAGLMGIMTFIVGEKSKKLFVMFMIYMTARYTLIIISFIITYVSYFNIDLDFNTPPVNSVLISLTVDLYDPSQIPTQKNNNYRQYKIGSVGRAINEENRKRAPRQEYDYARKDEMILTPTASFLDKPIRVGFRWSHSSEKVCGNWFSC